MECQSWVFLGVKVKPGPIERFKIENFGLDNTVERLRNEAEKKTDMPASSLELIHHGKILRDNATLQDSGVKNGDMVHVLKKKVQPTQSPPPSYSEAELQQLNTSLRTLGCSPNAPGWTRAMQLLNDESTMSEIIEQVPSLGDNCVALSILNEVELLAALGANTLTMRCAVEEHPELVTALRHLIRLVHAHPEAGTSNDNAPVSGYSYSLEALSEDEDADEEENEDSERTPITQEQLAAALQATTGVPSYSTPRGGADALARLLQPATPATPAAAAPATPAAPTAATPSGAGRSMITPEMFSEAISEVISNAASARVDAGTQMEEGTAAASSATSPTPSPAARDVYRTQLNHMHEMGLLDTEANAHALHICSGDVNAAINLIFTGVIGRY